MKEVKNRITQDKINQNRIVRDKMNQDRISQNRVILSKENHKKTILVVCLIMISSLISGCTKVNNKNTDNNSDEYLASTIGINGVCEETDINTDSSIYSNEAVFEPIAQNNDKYVVENQEYVYSIAGDIGQLGEEGDYYSKKFPNDAFREVVAYQTYADVNHDGINDLIQLSFYIDKSISVQEYLLDDEKIAFIKVFRGLSDGNCEKYPRFISREFSSSHTENGTMCITHKDGLDYFLLSNIWEGQGKADYDTVVFYIDDEEGIIIEEEASTYFAVYEDEHKEDWTKLVHREDAISGFRGMTDSWANDAIILISFNIDMDPEEMNSIDGDCKANNFYEQIWERDW